jgi:superfamily II DNA or RNA helicase
LHTALSDERNIRDEFQPTFDLKPYTFQQEILERIQAERTILHRNRHLIVAATGTGKTMVAAFDFRQWREWRREQGFLEEPTFLFVAHREEILRQSLATFRAVLRNQNFGDLMVGGCEPAQKRQLFLSIQTLNARDFLGGLDPTFYSYLVIDEFHHTAAPSYLRLLHEVKPDSLLGLTATPERADGLDITGAFGGNFTAEIRLPDAVNRKLLCPFHYFGITDSVDYSAMRWERGFYVRSDLEGAISANDIRCGLIIDKVREIVLDVRKVRGLGFCVSQAHAAFMAAGFNLAGISSAFLTAESPLAERRTVQRRLENREINVLFVVDLFNEGVDIPAIDTVLFLRPTESLTVFLQQFGRGLRLAEGKECLTVLDFIGQAHHHYRLDLRYRALSMNGDDPLEGQVRDGFTRLPAGCFIQLERQAREYILANLHQAIDRSKARLVQSIRVFEAESGLPLSLSAFLEFHHLDSDAVFRRAGWSRLCAEAGVAPPFSEPDENQLTKGLRRLQHIDDPERIDILLEVLDCPPDCLPGLPSLHRQHFLMLYFVLWGKEARSASLSESLARLQANPHLRKDLRDFLNYRRNQVAFVSPALHLSFPCPLHLHSSYTRDEILAAIGYWSLDRQPPVRQGVIFIPEINTDVFFITLNKQEEFYSPTTMYEDYAISDTLFHWQSQSTTSIQSPTGQRYIHHRERNVTVLLFVREDRKLLSGLGSPFHFLGPADHVSHQGSRPISITWSLRHPIPAHLQRETSRLLVG